MKEESKRVNYNNYYALQSKMAEIIEKAGIDTVSEKNEVLLALLNRATLRYAEIVTQTKNQCYFGADGVNRSLLEILVNFLYIALELDGNEAKIYQAKYFVGRRNVMNVCLNRIDRYPNIDLLGEPKQWFQEHLDKAEIEIKKMSTGLKITPKELIDKTKLSLEDKISRIDEKKFLNKITPTKYPLTHWYIKAYKLMSYTVHSEPQSLTEDYKKDIFGRHKRKTEQSFDLELEAKCLDTAIVLANLMFQKAFELKLLNKPTDWDKIPVFQELLGKSNLSSKNSN